MKLVHKLANNRKALGILIFQGLYYFILIVVENSHTLTPAGTIGTHSLTVAELPAHTHGRGTTDITGQFYFEFAFTDDVFGSGCFSKASSSKNFTYTGINELSRKYGILNFKASSKWSGTSQSIGSGTAHGHSWTGTQVTIDHMNPYLVAYCFKRIS